MLDELDAERREGEDLGARADRLLDDLDRQLDEQIAHLKHQRELIRISAHARQTPTIPSAPPACSMPSTPLNAPRTNSASF